MRRPEPSTFGRNARTKAPRRKLYSVVLAEDEGLEVLAHASMFRRLADSAGSRIPGVAQFTTRSVKYGEDGVYLDCRAVTTTGAPPGAIAAGVRAELRQIIHVMLGWALGGVYLELQPAHGERMVYDLPG